MDEGRSGPSQRINVGFHLTVTTTKKLTAKEFSKHENQVPIKRYLDIGIFCSLTLTVLYNQSGTKKSKQIQYWSILARITHAAKIEYLALAGIPAEADAEKTSDRVPVPYGDLPL